MNTGIKSSAIDAGYRRTDIFNDQETRNKIYRHLCDINDVISEDDIRKVKVSITPAENNIITGAQVLRNHTAGSWGLADIS
ncbi:MAG: hypothetical protein JST02_04195 [Bacteroidetes bacterium]|nr:hypothetical protein [Bacteroidota bacterium]